MKIVSAVLAGLIIWSGILTGFIVVEHQQASVVQVGLSSQSQDAGLLRAQLFVLQTREKETRTVVTKERSRERQLEHIVFKLIDALTQQEPGTPDKPSAYQRSLDNGQ